MFNSRQPSRSLTVHVRTVAATFYLTVFALIAPMMVFCEDGAHHAAVESVMSHCCREGAAAPGGVNRPLDTRGGAENGCGGSCTDTPFLTDIILASQRNISQGFETLAGVCPLLPAPSPIPSFTHRDVDCRSVLSPPGFGRSTVLQI